MRELMQEHARLAADGAVGRAVVTSVWGSAPRQPGAVMLATTDGGVAGSVSGGCVETATATEIAAAIERGTSKLVTFGVTDEDAWEVGLACGGTIKVLVQPAVPPEILAALAEGGGFVAEQELGGDGIGRCTIRRDESVDDLLRSGRSRANEDATLFLEVFPLPPTLLIFGAVPIAQALVPMAKQLGFHTVVADGRAAFATRERFPDADEVMVAWPEEAFSATGLDAATYVCVLSHDPKFDEPALRLALHSNAAYVGAIGSRKTQQKRRRRLREEDGFSEERIARLRGPIGLDLGGREPAETALAILAEMIAVRHGRERPCG